MAFELSGSDQERVQRLLEAERVTQAQARQELTRTAAMVADALAGKLHAAWPEQTERIEGIEPVVGKTPSEIPSLNWTRAVYMGTDAGGNDQFERLDVAGSVGDFVSEFVAEAGTATVFNTGFYAVVLAAKQDLSTWSSSLTTVDSQTLLTF